ncbi:MAG: immunoglobulin domain-containing protein [Undibacterium sp.]|nr:immunoglobulin domain-containing protein [Opitutaceae bacterium]
MKFSAALHRRLHWLNLPGALLVALLQRTPVVRVAASAANTALVSPVSQILKAAATTLGAVGAVHSMAGATVLVPSTPGPAAGTVGVAFPTIAFTVSGAQTAPASYTIGGSVPPGLTFKALGSTATGVTTGIINASTLQLSGTPTAAGQFVISLKAWEGTNGTATSSTFSYTVNIANPAPTITTQPGNVTVSVGGTVILSAAAAGSPTPTFQWFKGIAPNSTLISGATSSAYVISIATTADAGSYTLVATNSLGSATSNAATVTVTGGVTAPPAFTVLPVSLTAAAGNTAVFNSVATNSATYQWRKNGVAIPGATAAGLTFNSLTTANTGIYEVVATNILGSVTSPAVTLVVTGPLIARLSNLSVRTTLAANQILTVGLTMSGGNKAVLVRAAGPGLGALGVPGTMADPRLDLLSAASPPVQIAANDNWGDPAADVPAVSAAIAATGAFPFLTTTSLDAALVRFINGGHTVQVSGPAAGNLIVEAYDTGTANTPRLTNISARNLVGTGDDVLIAGFTVAGSGTKNLLIRAAGPSLAAFGVPGTLVDPKLVLRNSDQVIVAENDTYAAALVPVFASVGAFAFVPGAKDAALIVSLPPGGYTVIVSGADGGTGNAIIEVYELP